jgi:hypothetical protein
MAEPNKDSDEKDEKKDEPPTIEVAISTPGHSVTIKSPGVLREITDEALRTLAEARGLSLAQPERTGQML